MEIINYSTKYDESIKNLLVELQEYIVQLDKEKYNILTADYREKYFEKTMDEVNRYKVKIFLAIEDEKVIGLIVGLINNEDEKSYDSCVPKRGRVTELVISKKCRSNGIGKQLLSKMENYFKEVGCKAILINVFAYNEKAQNFYYKSGYFNRSIEAMKKIWGITMYDEIHSSKFNIFRYYRLFFIVMI